MRDQRRESEYGDLWNTEHGQHHVCDEIHAASEPITGTTTSNHSGTHEAKEDQLAHVANANQLAKGVPATQQITDPTTDQNMSKHSGNHEANEDQLAQVANENQPATAVPTSEQITDQITDHNMSKHSGNHDANEDQLAQVANANQLAMIPASDRITDQTTDYVQESKGNSTATMPLTTAMQEVTAWGRTAANVTNRGGHTLLTIAERFAGIGV